MSLISPSDQQRLRDAFAEMNRSVRLLFFTQTFGCETCVQTRKILDELPALSDKIAIEEVNVVLEGDKARIFGIERAPSIVVQYQNGAGPTAAVDGHVTDGWTDSRIRFLGAPAGYEFVSLVQAVLLAGGRPGNLSESSLKRLSAVNQPLAVQVFTTPT